MRWLVLSVVAVLALLRWLATPQVAADPPPPSTDTMPSWRDDMIDQALLIGVLGWFGGSFVVMGEGIHWFHLRGLSELWWVAGGCVFIFVTTCLVGFWAAGAMKV